MNPTPMPTVEVPARPSGPMAEVDNTAEALERWLQNETFTAIDRHFAKFLDRLSGGGNREMVIAAALASRSQGQGSICLDLRAVAGTVFPDEAATAISLRLPGLEAWMAALSRTPVVGQPGEFRPLILDWSGRLYLHRYWEYESNLAKAILERAGQEVEEVNESLLSEGLDRLFPQARQAAETDWQSIAAATAVKKTLCVISGGPGTGKTRTVAALLALLLEQAGEQTFRIALAAPTGKAAARLQDALKKWKETLACDEAIKARLPDQTFTLHRLLGSMPDSVQLKYGKENPLPFAVVVVDEASMVDLALMSKLFAAIPPAARVILLGDKDQLASVEAGAVLGDICRGGLEPGPLRDCVVRLEKNYRFGADNGILDLSQAINAGDADRTITLLTSSAAGAREGISSAQLPSPNQLKEQLREPVVKGFREILDSGDPVAGLQALNRFRILCVVRHGPYGVETVNRLVEDILVEARLIPAHERWYPGRPVLVTRNDYHLKRFNGDVGVILPDPASGELRVWFPGGDNTVQAVLPLRLPEHETVFAMTVHKSQGSEFDEVLLILPDRDVPVLTRELIYTGVTRASRRVEIWFDKQVFRNAISRRVERTSGLREALRGAKPEPGATADLGIPHE
jgi:exodeoxyribonuclease V alpha subunit